jgi:hypothetical protein
MGNPLNKLESRLGKKFPKPTGQIFYWLGVMKNSGNETIR